jgi:hypothetical protein
MPAPISCPISLGEERGRTPRRGSVGCPVPCSCLRRPPGWTRRPSELARTLEETLARLDGRVGRCARCKDSEAAAFLTRMQDWLSRQPRKQPVAETSWECPGSRRPVVLRRVGE